MVFFNVISLICHEYYLLEIATNDYMVYVVTCLTIAFLLPLYAILVYNYYYVFVFKVLHAGMPTKHLLAVVEVGQGSSQSLGSQYQETQ